MKRQCFFLIALLCICFSNHAIFLDLKQECKKSLLEVLNSGNGRSFLKSFESKLGSNWLEHIPFFDIFSTPPEIFYVGDMTESHIAQECEPLGHLKCIRSAVFEQHKKSFGWGCDSEGKPFITVMYNVSLLSGKTHSVGVIQHFIQASKEDPTLWISKTYDTGGKFIAHDSPACTETLDNEELVHREDFQALAKLILEGSVVVQNKKSGFLKLTLWRVW